MDKLIKQAVITAARIEARHYESLPEDAPLSRECERTIHGYADKTKKRLAPRQLVALLIAAALLLALSITAYAYREQIGSFIEEVFDGDKSDGTSGPIVDVVGYMAPSYIPSGYARESEEISAEGVELGWRNGDLHIAFYCYAVDSGLPSPDTEGAVRGRITVDGVAIDSFTKGGRTALVWSDGAYAYLLAYPEGLDEWEVESIIRSVGPFSAAF